MVKYVGLSHETSLFKHMQKKIHPVWTGGFEYFSNMDLFFQREIYNEDDPIEKQRIDKATWALTKFSPLGANPFDTSEQKQFWSDTQATERWYKAAGMAVSHGKTFNQMYYMRERIDNEFKYKQKMIITDRVKYPTRKDQDRALEKAWEIRNHKIKEFEEKYPDWAKSYDSLLKRLKRQEKDEQP